MFIENTSVCIIYIYHACYMPHSSYPPLLGPYKSVKMVIKKLRAQAVMLVPGNGLDHRSTVCRNFQALAAFTSTEKSSDYSLFWRLDKDCGPF